MDNRRGIRAALATIVLVAGFTGRTAAREEQAGDPDVRVVAALCRIPSPGSCEKVNCVVDCLAGTSNGQFAQTGKQVCYCNGNSEALGGSTEK